MVIALRPGRIIGRHADPVARRLAASSFTGLVDAFFVSLMALVPGHDLGYGAVVMALLSLYHTLRLNLAYPGVRHTVAFAASLLAYGFQLCIAVAFILQPDNVDLVKFLAFVLISAFAVGLNRAWALLEGTAVAGAEEGQAKGTSGTAPHPNGPRSRRAPLPWRLNRPRKAGSGGAWHGVAWRGAGFQDQDRSRHASADLRGWQASVLRTSARRGSKCRIALRTCPGPAVYWATQLKNGGNRSCVSPIPL